MKKESKGCEKKFFHMIFMSFSWPFYFHEKKFHVVFITIFLHEKIIVGDFIGPFHVSLVGNKLNFNKILVPKELTP